ncbi:MAG TPA: phosphonate C-P lyase system protein PhnG, partial [Clostridia bacterium]
MEYSEIAAEGRLENLKLIAEKIAGMFPLSVITPPSSGMIMIQHTDPVEKTPFYLGEAFVTKCEVDIAGNIGFGCVLGDDPERALYSAIIDAALDTLAIPQIEPLLKSEEAY